MRCNLIQDLVDAHSLNFECYRIRRRLAIPLPVSFLPEFNLEVREFSGTYPWQIWCLWALEQRLYSLSVAGTFLGHEGARKQCTIELEALSNWPIYSISDKLDLVYGHAIQLMATALQQWVWLPDSTLSALRSALHRAVSFGISLIHSSVSNLQSSEDLLKKSRPYLFLHNIPMIAQAALAMAAEVIGHPQREELSKRFLNLYLARLELNREGLTEGVSYDGYLANFALGWLRTQTSSVRSRIAEHPAMEDLEKQARGLACPGKAWLSAEIGDIEPCQMTFIWSALARLQQFSYSASRATLLDLIPLEYIRADGHWVLSQLNTNDEQQHTDANYDVPTVQQSSTAVTLSSGLGGNDLSAVISLCRSPMSHVQVDSGTMLIGFSGKWWITDPGYQQYLKTSERLFTVGATAHNTPVINGWGQEVKAASLVYAGKPDKAGSDVVCAVLDLTACYPRASEVSSVTRTVWRLGIKHIVVCDTIQAQSALIQYNWHADADVYWGEQGGAISLYCTETHKTLWIQSSLQLLGLQQQRRLRGSRGQCTLQVEQPLSVVHHWWCFSMTESIPDFEANGSAALIDKFPLSLEGLSPLCEKAKTLELFIHRDQIQVLILEGDELLGHSSGKTWVVALYVNGEMRQQLEIEGRQAYFSIPAVSVSDEVVVKAQPKSSKDVINTIERVLSQLEVQEMRTVPLRVYTDVLVEKVIGRCEILPDALEGAVEYAFYLIIDGHKTQVCWYQDAPAHEFLLSDKGDGQSIQVCGFVREKNDPNKKLSAASMPFVVTK